MARPRVNWTTDNPSGMHRCWFQHLCVLISSYALALALYIVVGLNLMLWQAQGNACKPTKEPMNYRGPSGDRTSHTQNEATPSAVSCPARLFHATEIVQKTPENLNALYVYGFRTKTNKPYNNPILCKSNSYTLMRISYKRNIPAKYLLI